MDVIYILQHWNLPDIAQIQSSIVLGCITLFALWPLRFIMHKVEVSNNKRQRERHRVIKLHIKEGHESPLRYCMQGQCATLEPQMGSRSQGLAAALAAEVAQSVHH